MSLVFSTVSANMANVYTALKTDKITDNINQTPYPRPPLTQWMDGFKLHYDTNSIAGTFSEANVVMVSMQSLLGFVNIGPSCDVVAGNMSNAIAAYWTAQVTPGAPQHLSAISSITNDAAKIAAPIKAYMCSQTSTLKTPSYEHLFQFIENQVKTIIWTVKETDYVITNSYPVTIS